MKLNMRQYLMSLLTAVSLVALSPALAQNDQLSAVEAAEQSVNELLARVVELRPYFESDPARYYAGIEEEVGKFVDFREVARGVMARFSEDATDAQLTAFGEKLRSTLTRFYGSALVEYGGQELTYLPPQDPPEDPNAPTNVRMQINSEGARIELQYALFKDDQGEWKLRNLFVGGINLRRQYHTQFAALMARNNNDIDAVIEAWQ
ncbi:MAG: ABC transporter substrate-binding protein [Pseudomonadota bacterium]|nr:ABC transporter substrate-binding protein [Pseudomonadota bacterium]